MDRRIKLHHIEAFLEIMRHRSLTEAAHGLGLTQPAMSRRLKELEAILGVQLLERDRRGVRITPQGARFLHHAEAGYLALEHAAAVHDDLAGGRLTVGALPSVAARLLPEVALRMAALAPKTTIAVEDGPHGFLMDALRAGRMDVVVGRLGKPDTMRDVTFTQLYVEHVVIVAPVDHTFGVVRNISQLDLSRLIYPSREAAIRPLVDRLFLSHGLSVDGYGIESVSDSFGHAMVRRSGYAWIISQGVVADALERRDLVLLPIDTKLTAGPVGLMTRADEPVEERQQMFARAVTQAVAALKLDGVHTSPSRTP